MNAQDIIKRHALLSKEMSEYYAYFEDELRGGKNSFRINGNPFVFINVMNEKHGFYIFTHIMHDGEAFYAKSEDLYNIVHNNIKLDKLDCLDEFNNCVTSYLDYHGRK